MYAVMCGFILDIRLKSCLNRFKYLNKVRSFDGMATIAGLIAVTNKTNLSTEDRMALATSVNQRLIFHPDNLEILLPTTVSQIYKDLMRGDAIIVAKDNGEAVAFVAYTPRLGPDLKKDLGLGKDVYGMSELYCVVADKEHSKGSMGITLVRQLVLMHQEVSMEAGIKEFSAVVTFQEGVVALARRTTDILRREHGMPSDMRVFAGQEIPRLFKFMTYANPDLNSQEDIDRINGTNPALKVGKKTLASVNDYISGGSVTNKINLQNTSMLMLSNAAEAFKTEAALREKFYHISDLERELRVLKYTV